MLRALLWAYIYGDVPPDTLVIKEIIVSIAIGVFFLLMYFGFKRIIFYTINPIVTNARYGALILSLSLALPWLLASLDLLGLFSAIIALVIMVFGFIFNLIYLIVTRSKEA
jgi:hypothetical protein